MSESTSQGIPFLNLNNNGLQLLKCNDISFESLKREGFNCLSTKKKPDQLVIKGKSILIAIEDKVSSSQLEEAVLQIKQKYLDSLPNTNYFIARAGERVKVFFRNASNQIIEVGTTCKGKEVVCFGPKVITGENKEVTEKLKLLAEQALINSAPTNTSIEILPPKTYFNPLTVKKENIFNLWQKIFVSTGENAHTCLATFVELLLYKGVSDAKLLPYDYSIDSLSSTEKTNSLDTYKNAVRKHIRQSLFPTISNQPGVINGFAFENQETVFKTILRDLNALGNLAQRQIDPDFKRRVIEAFLGSAHKEGSIKNGKHLTPRNIIQAIWELADPYEGARIIDPACGVGGFVLEGLNYPYEFNPYTYNCLGIDRDESMIILAKANMILHILDKLAGASSDDLQKLNAKIHSTFILAQNNGTGTLGELIKSPINENQNQVKHPADYVFANVPFVTNGVSQIDESLKDIGLLEFYTSCGLGLESRFVKYILGEIRKGKPGIAFVIVTDGILYRHKDKIRDVIKEDADVLGIISLPRGCFQNNNWKTSILIFKKKESTEEHSPIFLYNVENIGISLDAYRTPTQENDIPNMKLEWRKRLSGKTEDPKCRIISREEFNKAKRWSDLFSWCELDDDEDKISFSEYIESAKNINDEINNILNEADKNLSRIFSLEEFIEIKLGDEKYFGTSSASFKTTIKHARLNPGKYPLYSSQVDGPVEIMEDTQNQPILIDNEKLGKQEMLISWNIKGDPAKDIRLHDQPFYATENRGLIKVINPSISIYYVLAYLKEHMVDLGKFKRTDEAHVGKVKNLSIKIPTKEGNINLAKQKEIYSNYKKILDFRSQITNNVSEIFGSMAKIDIFK